MKKTLSIILTVAMLVSMLSVAVFADTATPIATPEDFLAMQENGNYYLENNIDLGALSSSFALEKFSGTLDGKNYTVKYSISESGKYTGLIGSLTGTVKNLTVNASIVFETALEEIYAGAIAGYASGSSVIDSCTSEGNVSITFLAGAGFAQVGGIAGTAYAEIAGAHNATISNCKNNAQITLGDGVDNSDMEVYAGGIAAKAGKIKSCINTGAITLNTTDVRIVNAAGIVADETGSLNIEVCTNYGYVNAKAAFQANAGGIAANVGKLSQCIVSRCANFGNVNAEITGANINMDEVNNEDYPNIFAVSGGIVASQYRYAYLINSANYAAISASSPTGIEHFENRSFAAGISGKAYSNISNCFDKHSGTITAYYTGPVYASLNDTTSSIKGKVINTYYVADEQYNTVNASADEADVPVIIPEQKLSETASYKNFNFETIWEIKTEVGYPTLVSVPYHTHVYSDPVYNNDHTCVKDGTNHIECSCGLSLNVPAPGTASGIHTFINYEFSDNKLVAKCEYCEATDSKAVEDGWFMVEDGWMYFKDG